MLGLVALVAALALVALAAGCGGSGADPGTGSAITPPPNTPVVASPEGSWTLTQLAMDGAIAPVPAGTSPVDAVFAEARVSGRSAVNSYSGPYTASADGTITIGPLASTQMAGPDEDMALEHAYLRALEGSRSFASDGEVLTMYSQAGVPLLVFARA